MVSGAGYGNTFPRASTNSPAKDVVVNVTATLVLASIGLPKASASATVIVCEGVPAVRICLLVVNSSCAAAAGLTASRCAAEETPAADTVMVGVPSKLSSYWKLTVPAPAGIVSGEDGMNVPFAEVVLKVTVNGPLAPTGLPKASSSATTIVPPAMPAVRVWAAVTKANWLAAAVFTVSRCVADAKPEAAAVSVGEPDEVSLYWKLTVLAPGGIVSGDAGLNVPLPEVELKFTLSARSR